MADQPDDQRSQAAEAEIVSPKTTSPPTAPTLNVSNLNLNVTATFRGSSLAELRDLDRQVPGAADRIIALQERFQGQAEIEQTHRHRLEGHGLWIGVGVLLLMSAIVFTAVVLGANSVAIAALTVTAAVIAVFVLRQGRGQGSEQENVQEGS